MKKTIIYICLLAAILLASCTSENTDFQDDKGSKGQVRVVMASRAMSGTGTPQDPVAELEVERFNHYWVVFTEATASRKIVAIVKKDCSLTERDEFMVALSPGAYKAYGFANIADSYLESLGIEEGKTMPNLNAALFTPDNNLYGYGKTALVPVEKYQSDYESGKNKGIPMTSINGITVNITDAVTVTTSIEVVRMFAKIEFVFSNETPTDLTLRKQSISNLTTNKNDGKGAIPLMNDDTRTFSFLDGVPFATLSHNFASGLELASGATGVSRSYYVLESKADETTNSFMLDFDVVKKGETTNAETPLYEYMHYGLTNPSTLTAIRRNDWLRIPISFIDWKMRLEARAYPPIGGYPEAEIEETESNEFIVKFKCGGDFSIRPFLRKFSETDGWFGVDNTDKVNKVYDIQVEDDDNLFTKTPEYKNGEILGTMILTGTGKACVTVKVDVITATTPVKLVKPLTRKIYITLN